MKIDPELDRGGPSNAVQKSSIAIETLTASNGGRRGEENSPPDFVDVFQQLINGLPEQIALLDANWNILAVNDAWIRTAALYDYSALRPGTNYFEFCRDRADEGHGSARPAVEGIIQIDAGGTSSFRYLYDGNDRWEGHTFQLCINRLEIGGQTFATITRYDVTELVTLRRQQQGFGYTLMEGQSEERRRIAREIHDSTLQLLTCMGLAIGQLKRARGPSQTLDIIGDMDQLLGETHREIRAISYLAHPPLLEEVGLRGALEALTDGFSRRTGIAASFQMDEATTFNWRAAEVAVYRFVQEALSNVHHHAKAANLSVDVIHRRSMLHAIVQDDGVGIPLNVAPGVGLLAMRERISELGGRLMLLPANPGTKVIASLPSAPRIRAVGDLSHVA